MSTPDPTLREPAEDRPDPRRWRALAVCLVAGFMTLLDVTIVNVALPSIRDGVGATDSDLQWIVSGYALAFGLLLVPAGRLGDARGRRTVFVVGVTLFTLSSLAAGVAPDARTLVAARLLQGLGGGLLNPQVSGLIQELFRGAERGKAFGLLGATIGVSTAVGPLLGGVIIGALGADQGWRWIFLVNLPIGVAAVVLAFRFLPAPRRQRSLARDLDPVGVVLLGVGVLAVLFPLVQQEQGGEGIRWWLVGAGVAVLTVFVAWERAYGARGRAPLVDVDLFRLQGYTSGATIGLLYFCGFTGVFFVLSLYLQNGLGYSPLLAGLAMTPFAAGSAVASATSGGLVHRYGRAMVATGLVLVVLGLVATDALVASVDGTAVGWWTVLPLLVAGIGSGMVISPNVTLTLAHVPQVRAGTAGGVLQTGQRIGSAVGIAAAGAAYFVTLAATGGSYRDAATTGLRVTVALTCLALVVAVVDVVRERRRGR